MGVEGSLAELRHQAAGQLGKVGNVVGTARLTDDGGVEGRRAAEPVDPLEQRGRAGEGDGELGDVAGLLERVDGRVEHGECVVGVGVDEPQPRRVPRDEADEEVDTVLVHVVQALAPPGEGPVGSGVPHGRCPEVQ